MGVKPVHKPKLGKTPIRIVIGTAVTCAVLALLHTLWSSPSFKQGALQAAVVATTDGLPLAPSSSQSSSVPRMFSFSTRASAVAQEETAGSLDEPSSGAEDKGLSLDPSVGQKGQRHDKEKTDGEEGKEIDEAHNIKGGSQEGNVDEQQQYEEEESREVVEEVSEEGVEGDDDDYEVGEEQQDDEQEEQEEVLNSVKQKSKAASNSLTLAAISEQEEEETIPSLAECQTSYGDRRFLHEDEKALPTILYSFPGSGNTWTRLLIDFSTGIYSGTILAKPKSKPAEGKLPGQGNCDQMVSVIKAHPHQVSPEQLFSVSSSDPRTGPCSRLGHIRSFDRFILLTRNPFDAIWSEYRRTASHVMLRDDFDLDAFAHIAVSKLSSLYKDMVRSFREVRRTLPEGTFSLQYEKMLDPDLRLSILSRLIEFIGLNEAEKRKEMRRRLQCAFVLAEHEGGGRRGSKRVEKQNLDKDQIMTTKDVYPPKIACRMWDIFGAEAKSLGYTLPNGIMEEECEKI